MSEKETIYGLIENLCVCIPPDADIERLKQEAYHKIKEYADSLAIEFASNRAIGNMPKWALRNELLMFKSSRKKDHPMKLNHKP